VNLLRYALKRLAQDRDHPLAKDAAWREALAQCLGEDAQDLEALSKRKHQSLGGESLPMGLGDFFHDPGDELHPDAEDDEDEADDEDGDEDEEDGRR
jgi:hypothetical protein